MSRPASAPSGSASRWWSKLPGSRLLAAVSLRVKITIAFVTIVVAGTVVSTVIGSGIATSAMREEALKRVRHGLETAHMVFDMRLARVRRSVVRCADSERLRAALQQRDDGQQSSVLAELRSDNGLDLVGMVSGDGLAVAAGRPGSYRLGEIGRPLDQLVAKALRGQAETSVAALPLGLLARHGEELAAQAYLPIVPVPRARPDPEGELKVGLALVAVAPVEQGGRVVGVVYGGVLLSRNHEIVDEIKRVVFGGEVHRGRDAGTASIFLGDVRVSTNVMSSNRERAVGTRASAAVVETVLGRGQRWLDRAFVVNDWYVSAYDPIVDGAGRRIGMLYVGVLEAPYLAARTSMMLTFLVVAAAGVLVVLGLTYTITRSMIRPLEDMVAAANRVADGDLDQPVRVYSADEIGRLASSFNRMQASLGAARGEVEEWTRTLERRVQERTDELVAVQAQMVQTEKLVSLGRMAAGVAHEINNPLGGIMTFAMLAQEDCPADHPLRRNLDIIASQTLRCRDIVKGLLEFSRQSTATSSATDVRAVVERTLTLVAQQASCQNIRTVLQLGEQALPPVLVDPGRLQQVAMNLLLNAVDAMDEHGELTVQIVADPEAGEVVLRVQDTGKGIADEHLPLIFEPFFTTKEVGTGTGLGLAIVHGIVTQAGGTISVETSGRGTTFTVRLPVMDERAEAAAGQDGGEPA